MTIEPTYLKDLKEGDIILRQPDPYSYVEEVVSSIIQTNHGLSVRIFYGNSHRQCLCGRAHDIVLKLIR